MLDTNELVLHYPPSLHLLRLCRNCLNLNINQISRKKPEILLFQIENVNEEDFVVVIRSGYYERLKRQTLVYGEMRKLCILVGGLK